VQNKPTNITIHVEYTHSCGQVMEQIVSMDLDDEFSMELKDDTLPALIGGLSVIDKVWVPPVFARPYYTVSGHYSKVNITGIEHKGNRLLCMTCGADMLFPDSEE